MIKYMADEPSVGLFYIQQHTQKAVPDLIKIRNNVMVSSQETIFHTEDLEDSIIMVKSMKEYGFPIADEMIKDINKSLVLMATKQSKRVSHMGETASRGHAIYNLSDGGSTSYFSSIFKSGKQKTSNISRPQVGISKSSQEELLPSYSSETSTMPVTEADDELHFPRPVAEEKERRGGINLSNENLSLTLERDDEFTADKEAELEKWLKGIKDNI